MMLIFVDLIHTHICLIHAATQIVTHIYFGSGGSNTSIHWWKTQCTGTETHLVNCTRKFDVDCEHEEDVGVICSQPNPG